MAADGAGLEPSATGAGEAVVPPAEPHAPGAGHGRGPQTGGGRNGAGKMSRAHLPVTIATVMALALPTLAEQMLSAVIGFTDTIVAGHTGGDDTARAASAAAVGTMTYLQWFAGLMTSALGVGASAIVSRSIGAGRPRMANRVAGTACAAAFAVGIGVALIFFFGARPLTFMFGLRDEAAGLGVSYLHIMCWTVCFQTAGQIGMACLRGAGDTLRPMLVTAAITVVNGIASPALTFGWFGLPQWGVRGNATGTLLAFVISGALTFAFLISGQAGLRLRGRHFRIMPHLLVRVARVGLWSWIEGMILWGGQAAIVMLVMHQVDKAVGTSGVTMAAHNATLRIESLAFLPGFGFAIACSSLVGQYLGAKKPDEAVKATVLCNRLAFWTMTIAAVPMVVIPHWMLAWMVDSAPVVEMGVWPLIIAGLAQPGFAISIVKSGCLKGAGDTKSPMFTSLTGMGSRVVVVLATMAVLVKIGHPGWGLVAVWVAIFLDLAYRAVVMEVVFRRGRWKLKKV
jgi:putative MATE family efflux protein